MPLENRSAPENEWIEPLRRNSWEMELLLTGFVLIGLLRLPEQFDLWWEQFNLVRSSNTFIVNIVGFGALGIIAGIRIITINLIILLLMRGFWIGVVGLSSTFPNGINIDSLNYAEKFARDLEDKQPNSEQLIIWLDNLCSSIFALSFLFLFIALSAGVYFLQLFVIGQIHDFVAYEILPSNIWPLRWLWSGTVIACWIVYLLAGMLKMFDFVTVGTLKRIRAPWFVKPYFRLSRFVNVASLGYLYRPIYYMLTSNVRRRTMAIILLVYLSLTIVFFFGFDYRNGHIYYPTNFLNQYELSFAEYENMLPEDYGLIDGMVIQSDIISGRYIKLFIPYDVDDNARLERHCPDLKPISGGLDANIDLNINDTPLFGGRSGSRAQIETALECFSSFYQISIADSTYSELKFLFFEHPEHRVPGLITYIPVPHLQAGYYELEITAADEKFSNIIQFWKE